MAIGLPTLDVIKIASIIKRGIVAVVSSPFVQLSLAFTWIFWLFGQVFDFVNGLAVPRVDVVSFETIGDDSSIFQLLGYCVRWDYVINFFNFIGVLANKSTGVLRFLLSVVATWCVYRVRQAAMRAARSASKDL